MTEQLYRLTYYSYNEIAEHADGLADPIDSILEASRRNNAHAGVTGALMFNSGYFGQVLEGQRRAVEATFERIQRDTRHSDVSLLAFEIVETRAFPTWSMGFVGTRADGKARYDRIADESGFDPLRMKAHQLFERLRSLAIEQEHNKEG